MRERMQTFCLSRIGGDWGWEIGYRAANAVAGLATADPDWAVHQVHDYLGAFLMTVDQASGVGRKNLVTLRDLRFV